MQEIRGRTTMEHTFGGLAALSTISFAAAPTIARVVRCAQCGELALEEARERLTEEEVAVRYGCTSCNWHQTRLYFDSEAKEV